MKQNKSFWAIIALSSITFLLGRFYAQANQKNSEDFVSDMKHIGNEKVLEVIKIEEAKNPSTTQKNLLRSQASHKASPGTAGRADGVYPARDELKQKITGHPERNTKYAVEGRIHSPFKPSDYKVVPFNLSGKVKGLSNNQIDQHLTLYTGYVKKWNQIEDALQTVGRKNISSIYSPFRALKVGETYAMNGTILHELYFENLGDPGGKPFPETQKLLENHFGSVDAYLKDLKECGIVARGWVLTCYSLFDGSVRNYVLDTHNDHVPIMVIPLIVLDVYEHAYMIEFGIKRKKYLNVFADNINWPVIEERVKKFIPRTSK